MAINKKKISQQASGAAVPESVSFGEGLARRHIIIVGWNYG